MPLLVLLTACAPVTWTRDEAADWYTNECRAGAGVYCRPLWYAGSDDADHYFLVHVLDTWHSFRVPRSELELPDVRPLERYRRGTLYYAVEPERGFVQVDGVSPPF